MKVDDRTNESKLDETTLRSYFADNADVIFQSSTFGVNEQTQVLLIYAEGMADTKQINQVVLPRLHRMYAKQPVQDTELPLPLRELGRRSEAAELSEIVFSGQLLLYFPAAKRLYSFDVPNLPRRKTEESAAESSLKGSRDGFTEETCTNIALIRKRLRTSSLCCEKYTIGERSRTTVALLYIRDIVSPDVLEEARRRLKRIDVDAFIGIEQLQEALSDSTRALLPLTDYIGRPDFAAETLLNGRLVFLMEGSPMAVIAPITLTSLIKSPEDAHMPFYIVSMQRLVRFMGLLFAMFLPGFYIALTSFNMEQIPYTLMTSIASSRVGLPFSNPLEAFIVLGLFEVFREAGVRLPKAVGQTVTVVGALIVGDSAIRAGITCPAMIVIAAITVISTFTLVNQSLSGAVTVVRFYMLIFCCLLGMYGFFIGLFTIILYLSTLNSFGVPYLAPLSPPYFKDMIAAILKKPWRDADNRPEVVRATDTTHQGERNP